MPERVHQRLDELTPVENAPPENRKRKRKHQDVSTTASQKSSSVETQKVHEVRRDAKAGTSDFPSRSQPNGHPHSPKLPSKSNKGLNGATHKPESPSLKDRARTLCPERKRLPVWSQAAGIRKALRDNDILLLVGETGSGKSTQVPQILMQEDWCKARSVTLSHGKTSQNVTVGGCIAITEPRRVAAITLARRVAEEMGSPLGSNSPASRVGYSVRFDNSTSPATKIKFLTEGMLLQEMLRDPYLKAYSAVIVDEVHERGVNVDLVMGFMRQMATGKTEGRGGVPLKVVVMSATAEMERLGNFFEEGLNSPAPQLDDVMLRNGEPKLPEDPNHDDAEESEWSGISSDEEDKKVARAKNSDQKTAQNGIVKTSPDRALSNGHDLTTSQKSERKLGNAHIAICYIEGRQYPVTIKYTPQPVQDIVDATRRTIFQIHYKEPMPGDILVFLTGQETVESLESLVKEHATGLGPELPKLLVLPLFAALPQAAQQRVFQPAPAKTRKVIISTNIAETSVTVSGVRFVIDCGKAKVKHFRSRIGLDSLLVKPISKSAAIQRKGRAGREAPGHCYRLYTESDYLSLQQSNTPEILRCDLSHAILTMKARGITDVINFPFLDRPPREAMEKALLQLYQLGALTESGDISATGQQMAKLPLAVSLGRVLIEAAEPSLDCVSEVIDIISCLSVENIFLNLTSEEKKEAAEVARRDIYRREGDHLTLLATVQAYLAEHSDRKSWAERHFVSHRAMQAVMDVRKQLRAQFKSNLVNENGQTNGHESSTTRPELATSILKCFLKGFATNTARLFPDGSYKTMVGNQSVAIHPSSVLFGRKVEAIMYNEYVFTNKTYARGVSAVQTDWIGEALGV